jgi:hypothetical protein
VKTAIYIEQGVTQLVLTPECEWEKKITSSISEGEKKVSVMRGSFYECRGGWIRRGDDPQSLILRLDFPPPE